MENKKVQELKEMIIDSGSGKWTENGTGIEFADRVDIDTLIADIMKKYELKYKPVKMFKDKCKCSSGDRYVLENGKCGRCNRIA